MINFKDFFLQEKLITFGGKAYPKFGQIVILAGGAGSGKGFVSSRLLGIEGNTLDVDALKTLALGSQNLAQKIKDETGQDIKKFDLKNPDNVAKLHDLMSKVYHITDKNQQRIFSSALTAPSDRKPNLIFDVTLKDMGKLESISRNVQQLGYDKSNIHIVWVVNDIEVAIKQNQNRSRVVSSEILMSTHEGASMTMRKLIDKDTDLQRYMDGDIWFVFNKAKVDSELQKSDAGGSYISKANYVKMKKKGSKPLTYDQISQEILDKIQAYTPSPKTW